MEHSKPRNIKGIIVIVILILVLVGLGVLAWIYRDKLTGSAAVYPSPSGACVTLRPTRDIISGWYPQPWVPLFQHYKNIDEVTANDTDYLWSISKGSNDAVFGITPSQIPNKVNQITVVARAKTTTTGYDQLLTNINIGGWKDARGWTNLTTSWNVFNGVWKGDWTSSQLHDMQVKMISAGGSIMVSQLYVLACNTPSYFKPDTTATRATLAYTIAKTYNKSYGPATPTFKDVPKGYWAFPEIEGLNQAGIMKGYGDGTFRPENNTTRADITVVVSRAAGIAPYDNPTPSFKDVPKTYWAYKEIEGMKKAGLIQGYGDGTYKPDGAGTRATLATILYRAKKLTGVCTGKVFADVGSTYWACKEVETVAAKGWMSAVDPSTTSPTPIQSISPSPIKSATPSATPAPTPTPKKGWWKKLFSR